MDILQELQWILRNFGPFIKQEDLEHYLPMSWHVKGWRGRLANSESEALFCTGQEQKIAGFSSVTGVSQTEQELEDSFEIQRIYVLSSGPRRQGNEFA